ncbi:ComEA family DNA-binding protein [Algibacter miyuki]|uniref:ComEA family DNA-binding protein n=1 Tax=Algibacter miyuki TaxID=1306933 RepID=A0ABV5H1V2_9FLAO|nr:helix-hairpin-helix domain-containing protein [Algibacter miyuki]MDN3666375.1 helix-hairpin-helix domain-containing protein [Algibacter miyuki]
MKSHVTFTKSQRHGIFLLTLLIIILQCVYFFVDFSSEDTQSNNIALASFTKEIDSLKLIELENRKPKIFPFNPNFITDYKGASLGMSNEEIDRLLAFRKQDKWVNSINQFQEVTKVSDSLLNRISPYFKFPEWITKAKPVTTPVRNSYKTKKKTFAQKQDLNTATAVQLQKVYGIGASFSSRIIKYRNKFVGGFIADEQLQAIYGLNPETIENIKADFTVKTPRQVQKLNLNTATIDQLVTVEFIDYDVAHHIVEQRHLREGFKTFDELIKVKDFPVNRIEIIKLYLLIDKIN